MRWRSFILEVLALTAAVWLAASSVCKAQDGPENDFLVLPPSAGAMTSCMGGRVRSAIDVDLLGYDTVLPDSVLEILVHERSHQSRAVDSVGKCVVYRNPAQLLHEEVLAYCESLPLRIKVMRGDVVAARDNYLGRLTHQFHSALPKPMISQEWERGCPAVSEGPPKS